MFFFWVGSKIHSLEKKKKKKRGIRDVEQHKSVFGFNVRILNDFFNISCLWKGLLIQKDFLLL